VAETTLLRTSAIVQNAAVGTSRPSQVSVGALSLVQVKPTPVGPQVQEGQQRPVQILPPRDAKSAVVTGGLPMVNVKMTQNGPQRDDGRDHPVVIRDHQQAVTAGALPMVQVKMENGKPQVQNLPNVQSAPPQIQSAAPVLSQPRVARMPAPIAAQAVPVLQAAAWTPGLSIDQLLLCRHRVDAYLGDLRASAVAPSDDSETSTTADNAALAEGTLVVIDQLIAAASAQDLSEVPSTEPVAVAPVARAGAYVAPGSQVTYPARNGYPARGGYVAPGPGGRRAAYGRSQGNAALAPRRVVRSGAPLPLVQVKMDGQRPTVQNPAEVAAAKEALVQAQAEALVAAQAPIEAAGTAASAEG